MIATDAGPKLKKAVSAPRIMGWRMRLSVENLPEFGRHRYIFSVCPLHFVSCS